MTGSPLFLLYRALTAAASPLGPLLLRERLRRGKEDRTRLSERLGVAGRPRPDRPLVWLHGASVGESVALLPLVEALCLEGLAALITTGTVTSARVMAARLPAGAIHQFVPLDLPAAWRRFLDHWRPDLALIAESELWPNLIRSVGRRHVPLALVNARFSERSAHRWARAEGFIRAMLAVPALCLCQTEADAERLRRLGARDARTTGNLKYDVPAPPAPLEAVTALAAAIGPRPAWVAASTHADEEAMLLGVHAAVLADHPGLLTLLVPRQPTRGEAIFAAAEARGLAAGLRSRGDAPGEAPLYIADTIGELGLFYRAADLAFLGKSLAGGGGQSPIEAARLGTAVLHGPLVGNMRDVYELLDEAGGAIEVPDAEALAETVSSLLADPARLRLIARAAASAIAGQGGATQRTLEAVRPLLPTSRAAS